ncbi:flagellar hook-length control protein FliK [Chromatium okenii]|uniref:flagellar hook-length control protein FliK n=1 Tax=Chromatium okenii TaxID=61644 RepID=UPI0026EBDAB1|nr:flagellar hook-length control protein FliK [Chromatium okenii]MBV5308638.1 flagellar hook-length control protein FliK [Chromatium okenii]
MQSAPEAIETEPVQPVVQSEPVKPAPTPIQPVIETELETVAPVVKTKPITQSQPELIESAPVPIKPIVQSAPEAIETEPVKLVVQSELEPIKTASTLIQQIKNTDQSQTISQLISESETTIPSALINAMPLRSARITSTINDAESVPAVNDSTADTESSIILAPAPLLSSQQQSKVSPETQQVIKHRRFQPLFSEQGTLLRPIAIDVESKQTEMDSTDIFNSITPERSSTSISTAPLATITLQNTVLPTRPLDLATVLQPSGERYLGEPVKWLVQTNTNSIELKLHPANLGAIDIRVTMEAEKAHVQFLSSNSIVREVLEVALPRLRDSLAQDGLQLGTVSISDQTAEQRRGSGRELAEAMQQGHEHFDDDDAETQTETPLYRKNSSSVSDGQLDDFA